MALPSFSFGAEGVEYGRNSAYYATTTGDEDFTGNVDIQGNLTVAGLSTLNGVFATGNMTVDGNIATNGSLAAVGIFGPSALIGPTFPTGFVSGSSTISVLNGLGATTPVDSNDGVQNTMVIAGYRFTWGQSTLGVLPAVASTESGTITLVTPYATGSQAVVLANPNFRTVELQMQGGGAALNWVANFPASSVPIPVVMWWLAIGRA